MKTKIFILGIVFLLSNLYSQEWINSTNFSSTDVIKSVKFINPNTGLVLICNDGNSPNCRLLKTVNKGINWNTINSFNATINGDNDISMYFLNENTVFRFYRDTQYHILLVEMSTNGGYNWNTVWYQNVYPFKPKIMFLNQTTGFFAYSYMMANGKIAGAIYKTNNGGYNWSLKHTIQKVDADCRINDIAVNYYNGNYDVWAVGYQELTDDPYYSNYFRCKSSDLGETFFNAFDPDSPYLNTFNYVEGLNTAPESFAVIGLKNENNQIKKSYCTIFNSENRNEIYLSDNPFQVELGGLSESNGKLFTIISNKVFMSSNSGLNWIEELTYPDITNYSYDVIWSFNDIAYFGSWHGNFYTRKIAGNYNTMFDWLGGTNWSIAIDGENVPTSGTGYFRGGTVALYANQFQINGNYDTTARFYYWGGDCNASMNYSSNSYLINSGSDINADYKTLLKTTTGGALYNANQVKALKDTNGVTNLVYESMGGIFYTRTKPNGTFKAEEIVSGSMGSSLYGHVTYENSNPYICEINGNPNDYNTEKNISVCFERREGNNVKIFVARRYLNLTKPEWALTDSILIQNVPSDFKCFPKLFMSNYVDNVAYYHKLITYLKPVNGSNSNVKLCATFISSLVSGQPERDIVPATNIYEYAIKGLLTQPGASNFILHVTYRIGQTVYYKKCFAGYDGQPGFNISDIDPQINISSDASGWRASLDIALKNTANSSSAFNMQPVVTYQGRKNVRIIIDNEDGPPSEIITNNYPIYVKERLPSGQWSSVIVSYNNPNINEPQMNPTIVGSKHKNSCIVSYGKGYSAPYTFMQKVHLWNGSTSSGYNCNPISYPANDVKIVKGGLIDDGAPSLSQRMMTLSYQSANLYNVGFQQLNISNGIGGDDSFEEISGLIEANYVQYTFNLGNILVNNQNINFANNLDTVIDNIGELNNNLASKSFLLNENDTLIIGRNASYVLNDPNAAPANIEYWVKLMNKSTNSMHRLLAHDTIHTADSVIYEFLEGYIIRNIPNGSDSFYVQLEIDTVDGNFGIGGGLGGDGDGGGDSPNSIKKKIFWENEKLTGIVNNIPKEFNLYQNFPNPFNPATVIKYDLPKDVKVSIKIYDVLGREVTTLVNNEFKNAGRYELNWNAGNYASGVYIYRIEVRQAGSSTVDYVNTKKMVLLK